MWVDDIQVGTITPGNSGLNPATVQGEVILSLLVSEGTEYNALISYLNGGGSLSDYKMYVEWIRVWR